MLNDGYIYVRSTNGDFAASTFSPLGSITERRFFEEILLLCSKTRSKDLVVKGRDGEFEAYFGH
jgi:hypothetical protein